ncbi:tRNA-uridine aminocarboxypropyltransferase, partial [Ideonella sp.]|uniref:tRNA-uridine aminocarboxypropyltransferase n=1 Tax=Ideonella sp. TaxID=1929293 RepID=UPI003BB5D76B
MPHAVARVRAAALAHSTSTLPRLDRGEPRKLRCARCRLIPSHCLCALRPSASARSAICLVMAEFEALKPSNTGWLIADVLADTTAFAWHRNAPDPDLLQMLADPQWQPVVVFPGEFAEDASRVVHHWPPAASADDETRRPLFILLDGTWSEARKIFRKSPYLATLPVLSLQTE